MHTTHTDAPIDREIFSVSRLNSEVRFLLENNFPFVWVEGEISNFSAPNSGHWYFSLKDAGAQVRCAMFRGQQRKLNFAPKDGSHVLLKARVSLYENRGDFQLIAEEMEERGEGKLRQAFELLKKKLETAGWFHADRKKPFPIFPKQIGVVTSPTGAAIKDILTVLKRRLACVPVIIYPTLVQGETAATQIVNALALANRRNECDVLILARGGGSLEDLWPFNEEKVAQAIMQSQLPIISGVGHEIDFTIADFVADKRAATPSAAAEMIVLSAKSILETITAQQQQLLRQVERHCKMYQQQLTWMEKHLLQQHPKNRLLEKMQKLDFYESSLRQLQTRMLMKLHAVIREHEIKLYRLMPLARIHLLQNQLKHSSQQLIHLLTTLLNRYQTRLSNAGASLHSLSPLATLNRGFAIASVDGKTIVHDAAQVKAGDQLTLQLAKGKIRCQVLA